LTTSRKRANARTSDSKVQDLRCSFIEDGAQSAAEVTREVVAFIEAASLALDIAIYDFHADVGTTAEIAAALRVASERGVRVRLAYNTEICTHVADARPMQCAPAAIASVPVETRAVSTPGSLMHHKYIVRDRESVWTGSTNGTDDAFSREENVLITIEGPEIAAAYGTNFERLWAKQRTLRSGGTGDEVMLRHQTRVTPYFSPWPPHLSQLASSRIADADRRVRVVSPVVTSGAVLGTLAERVGREKFNLDGAFDHTQMEQVQREWSKVPHNRWKIEAWRAIEPRLSGKSSTPYAPDAVHDYMHAKFIVADEHVVSGSYNLSKHGEINAENVVHIVSDFQASRFVEFADRIAARYRD
jgi:phosphatidylserine/phosphatidylglycerophosphate/cardiolipin synthase-like enzyme